MFKRAIREPRLLGCCEPGLCEAKAYKEQVLVVEFYSKGEDLFFVRPREGTRRGEGSAERYGDGGRKVFDRPFYKKVARAGGGAGGVRGNALRTSGRRRGAGQRPANKRAQVGCGATPCEQAGAGGVRGNALRTSGRRWGAGQRPANKRAQAGCGATPCEQAGAGAGKRYR